MPRASKRKSKPLKSSKVDGVRSASNKATMKKGEPIDDHFHSYANRSLGMIEILMLPWKMNAQKQGYFTQDEWQRGLKALTVDTVRMPQNFADFYSFAFQFCLTDIIHNDYKVINMDQWTSFLRFCSQISFPDLKNYDTIEAWPLILDDFVECMREEKLATAES
ncbi:unnamed protein product [Camellia sinensis]